STPASTATSAEGSRPRCGPGPRTRSPEAAGTRFSSRFRAEFRPPPPRFASWPMNCLEARFRLYAYLDRELSRSQAEALERHLEECEACALRARSARGLAGVLKERLDRPPAPERLRLRIKNGTHPVDPARTRAALVGLAAAIVLLIVPI